MQTFSIQEPDNQYQDQIWHRINHKTKPVGALGQLETIAAQLCRIQQTLTPQLSHPHIIVFAADHGIVREGVSNYPSEVTCQMVQNFVQQGAAINVFCRQNNITLKVIDAGVNGDLHNLPGLIHQKIGQGTRNFATEPAMTPDECALAIQSGARVVNQVFASGCNVIGLGEMGIGNTSSASVLMHKFTQIPLADCIGPGTGLNQQQVSHKLSVLQQAVNRHRAGLGPLEILATFGGFEIAQMCGAMLQAAENKMVLLIDGFIATAALLSAYQMYPAIRNYCLFCHQSSENGHARMLAFLQARAILHLDLRLGEGTGCALAYPVVEAAVNFLNQMASFESAGVSQKKNSGYYKL